MGPAEGQVAGTAARARKARDLPPSGGLKAELSALKKERILAAATRLFRRHGYSGCSMDEIAAALGVSKPYLYYQFRDKQEILAGIAGHGAALTLSAVDEAIRRDEPAAAAMRWFCRRLTGIVVDHSEYLAVYLRETSNLNEANYRKIMRLRALSDARLVRLVERGISSGDFVVADPVIAVKAITAMISYCFQFYRSDGPQARDGFIEIMSDIAMRTLRPVPGK